MKAADLNKVKKAARALADASDVLDGNLWDRAIALMGDLNRFVNQNKRKGGK